MAQRHVLSPPEPLILTQGNVSQNWKRFKQKWGNYEIAIGIATKDDKIRVATLLTVIGDEALDVYNSFTWNNPADNGKIEKVLEQFEHFCEPRKNTIYERYMFFSRNQESGESIDKYVTVLKNMAENCEFAELKESLVRDRIVYGVSDSNVKERLLRVPDLSLKKALEVARAAEVTQSQLKQMDNLHNVHSISKKKTRTGKSQERKSTAAAEVLIDCKFCGRKHVKDKSKCPAYGQTCRKCGDKNHFAVKCKTKKSSRADQKLNLVEESDSEFEEYTIDAVVHHVAAGEKFPKQLFASMNVNNGKDVKFQLDCGATCNLLPLKEFSDIMGNASELTLRKTSATLKMYNGTVMNPLGKCTLMCSNGKVSEKLDFFVVQENVKPLLGAESCQKLEFIKVMVNDKQTVNTVNKQPTNPLTKEQILEDYSDVFEGLGCMDGLYHIDVDKTVKPVVHPPRKVPVALRESLREELDKMVQQGIITPVTEPTDWVSSLVLVNKTNKLRVCIDPQDLNKALKRAHYPLPTIEDVATRLGKAKVFSVLDAKNGFWQVQLDKESSYLTTFNTPFGRFRWLRMPFGIKTAPEEYQRRVHENLQGLQGVEDIVDDILCIGEGDTVESAIADHDRNLIQLLERCREKNIKLNPKKLQLRKTEVPYIGHLVTGDGLKPDPNKVKAILEMPTPDCVKSLQRLLGMITYLSKFLPNLSTATEPLRRLLDKDVEWHWEETHEKALGHVKRLITSEPVLRYFDNTKEVTLQCDASESGLGATIMQEGQPVAFSSRALTATERNYAQIEKELLSIVHGCTRFDQYVYGREITVESDHKPLESIFKKPLLSAPKRLQRMLLQLQRYNIKLVYKPGTQMYIADTLSRAYMPVTGSRQEKSCEVFTVKEEQIRKTIEQVDMVEYLPITAERLADLRQKTEEDESLQRLKQVVRTGWPSHREEVPPDIRSYYHFREELTIQDGILFKGNRVIVPAASRAEMIKKIHSSHIGIEGCLRKARDVLYWPGMSAEIKDSIASCDTCNTYQRKQQKEPLHSHDPPKRPWSKVAADLFDFDKKDWIIIVDYWSDYFEFNQLSKITSSSVIKVFKSQFARHGIPDTLFTDNGTQFVSEEFQDFAKAWQFDHKTSSPHFPQSNGKVENAVNSAKRLLTKAKASGKDPYLALLDWRNTPSADMESSPVQRLFGRRTKTLLPTAGKLLKPRVVEDVEPKLRERKMKQAFYFNKGAKELEDLSPGDTVRMKPADNKKEWRKARVIEKVEPRSYIIDAGGHQYRRNRRHLVKTQESVDKPVESEAESSESSVSTTPKSPRVAVAKKMVQDKDDDYNQQPSDAVCPKITRSGRIIRPPTRLINS